MQEFMKQEKIWEIGKKEKRKYKQEPLSLEEIAGLMILAGDVMEKMSSDERLSKQVEKLDTDNIPQLLKLISILLKELPFYVYKALAIILGAKKEDDVGFLKQNMKINIVLKILLLFFKQNDVKELKEDFLALQTEWKRVTKKPEEKKPTKPQLKG